METYPPSGCTLVVCEDYADPEPQVLSTRYIYVFRLKISRFIASWIPLLRIFVKYVVFFNLRKKDFTNENLLKL